MRDAPLGKRLTSLTVISCYPLCGGNRVRLSLLIRKDSGDSQPNSALSPALSSLSGPESARPSGRPTRATLSALSGLTGQAHNCEHAKGPSSLTGYIHTLKPNQPKDCLGVFYN